MRPRYENEKTLAAEAEFKADLEKHFGVKFHKLPIAYRADYAVSITGTVSGFAELKNRDVNYDTYDTLILSLGKYQAMEALKPYGNPVLFVRYNDGDYMFRFDTVTTEVGVGGRWDRDDWQDVEPVVHIPKNYLKKIEYGPSNDEVSQSPQE